VSWLVKIGIFFAGLLALVALAWMVFLPRLAERGLRAATGFDVKVQVLSANPFTGHLLVKGLTAKNPPSYPAPDFVDLRGLEANADMFTLLPGKTLTFESIDLDIAKLDIIRLHGGTTNVSECTSKFSSPKPAGSAPAPAPASKSSYLIKKLHIRLDQIVVQDFTGSKGDLKTYNLKLDHTYSNITDTRQLLVPDVLRTLYTAGLQNLARLLPGDFGDALAAGVDGIAKIGTKTGHFFKGLFGKLEQSQKP
jgi:hypothetical protein